MAECPSCGRFVGPHEVCPYCGASIKKRITVRAFKYGAIALALIGIIALRAAAIRSKIPSVSIEDINGRMNWAYIKVNGVVTRYPSYDPVSESLKFWISDGTGEIMLASYKKATRKLLEAEKVPLIGDRVIAEGTLRIKEDFAYLIINVPEKMQVKELEAVEREIGEITVEMLHRKVMVDGIVEGVREPYAGLKIIRIKDASGEIDVTIPTELIVGEPPEVGKGDRIRVVGVVSLYKNKPQIALASADGLEVLSKEITTTLTPKPEPTETPTPKPEPTATPTPEAEKIEIGKISADDIGETFAIEAEITNVEVFSKGVKLFVSDGTGEIIVLLWQNIYEEVPEKEKLWVGARIKVKGEVAEYKGVLEIIPKDAVDVQVIVGALPEVVKIKEVSRDDIGETFAIEAEITNVEVFSKGVKLFVSDGTGEIIVLLWQNIYEEVPEKEKLWVGARIKVKGEVAEYKGVLEIIPKDAVDVQVIVGALPEVVKIKEVSRDDIGETFAIEAEITNVEVFSKGVKLFVSDGTGEIIVLLWQNIYEEVPEKEKLIVGTRVRVKGELAEYRGVLEIIPRFGGDVEVIESQKSSAS
jgi:DNA/RNA endonuclease YhcR with UshA esterase domain